MATSYPTALDSYGTLIDNEDDVLAAHANDRGDAIEALEAKVGVDSSAVTSSLDYKMTHLPAQASDRDLGSVDIRALSFYSDVATGTKPLTITSTTLCDNLNADKLDSQEGSYYLALANATGTLALANGGTGQTSLSGLLNLIYPVGSIYTNASVSTNPGTLLGFGTWTAFGTGRVMVGIDTGQSEFDVAEETGGEKTHTLITAEMPAHTHTVGFQKLLGSGSSYEWHGGTGTMTTSSAGGDGAHNNLQPYIVVYMWKRTA